MTLPPPPEGLTPEPGWEVCAQVGIYRPEYNFISGDPEGQRIRVAYWTRTKDRHFVGKVWYGIQAEGPPLCAHGGSVAAVLDDVMGRCAWVAGHCVVAGSISVRFHHRVPLGTVLHLEAWVEECQGRKILVQAQMQAPEGDILASSEGTFIQISEEHFQTELRKLEAQGLASQDPGWRHKA